MTLEVNIWRLVDSGEAGCCFGQLGIVRGRWLWFWGGGDRVGQCPAGHRIFHLSPGFKELEFAGVRENAVSRLEVSNRRRDETKA